MTSEPLSRRECLARLGTTVALVALAACGDGGSDAVGRPAPGEPLATPPELRSRDGRLDLRLVVAGRTVRTGGRERFAYTYNGSTPGPTLRIRPGDTLTLTLVNDLAEPTNLHTHGLHVSPEGRADDVFVTVPPGASRRYVYEIPADHPSGLFWYHPHHHGTVAEQVFGGLAGAIVVEDALDEDAALRATAERLLVLSDPALTSDARGFTASMHERMQGREGDVVLVNGQSVPTIGARAGTLERWRVLNASTSRYHRLRVEDRVLHVIATDAGRIREPVARDEVLLAPGERVEVLVDPGSAGTYRLRSEAYDRGTATGGMTGRGGASSGLTIGTLVVSGDGGSVPLPASLPVPPGPAAGAVVGRRTLTFGMGGMGGAGGMGGMGGGGGGGGPGGGMAFTIDGRSFDPSRTDQRASLGTSEEWTIENPTGMDHPFHLHVWPFDVVDGGSLDVIPGGRKDTVNVPAGSAVRIRVAFSDIGGRTVYHCHILDHEDLGMMGVIEVR